MLISCTVYLIQAMRYAADLIITGTVIGQEQFGELSVMSTVEVSEINKGMEYDKIRIYQLDKIGDK